MQNNSQLHVFIPEVIPSQKYHIDISLFTLQLCSMSLE